MGFSRQEYWSGLTFPSPGHFPDPGIEPGSPVLQADSLLSGPAGELKQIVMPYKQAFCKNGRELYNWELAKGKF